MMLCSLDPDACTTPFLFIIAACQHPKRTHNCFIYHMEWLKIKQHIFETIYLLAYVVIILIIDNTGPLPRLNAQLYRLLPGLKSNTISCTARTAAVVRELGMNNHRFSSSSIWNFSVYGYLPTLERWCLWCLNTSIIKVNLWSGYEYLSIFTFLASDRGVLEQAAIYLCSYRYYGAICLSNSIESMVSVIVIQADCIYSNMDLFYYLN